ncbi:MAG: hypothetical protein A3D52_01110 [Candidatus Taylorbacteria bacterium RIFCSPHIGHO2_02_FULL_44_36]|uniref:Uncharacterized protein n=1 Tax=Candidatus Taylorbacteria bacterium RIFCSPLOWO2_12_FULL_44_15c TaxID=1802333 RepID=A0A1G2P6J0_9BACT|nr:MAG: hypothetical protein A3D52_01110 [Candidatus Taylorbacteria bacterium RIFCSPHIGHO2_02_FULL_44_36]OHA37907.1 MAG: hypothetical protein A3I97_00525 [Candidatus Taylorbacteria bacterium RIFCSPLOWO2_02_FULL_44_35]OHA43965.1 MAG: hypothetical protein A3G03_03440 [Candidatus Taylorbacteria bacterium RIFCSPLOWO2_12_FULL_44_15c]
MKASEHFNLIRAVLDNKVDAEVAIKHQKAEAKKPKGVTEIKKDWLREWEEKVEAGEDWRRAQHSKSVEKE